jgi:DNA recombination protein RmuC
MEVIVLVVLLLIFGAAFYITTASLRNRLFQEFSRHEKLLHQRLNEVTETLSASLRDTRHSVQTDLKSSTELMSDIHGKLGELSKTSRRIHEVGESIVGLQELLRAPKMRGGMGEYFLEDMLTQILPQQFFTMQYPFRDGRIADAVIQLGERLLCVDSKFPLEKFQQFKSESDRDKATKLRREFQRCVKKHIEDISERYIVPEEETYDFALMYIPAESVYYEMMTKGPGADENDSLILEYAMQKKVIPVSPNCIYAFLQVILIGLRGFQVEEKTKVILRRLESLHAHFEKFQTEFELLGKHLNRSSNTYGQASNRLSNFGQQIHAIEAEEPKSKRSSRKLPVANN